VRTIIRQKADGHSHPSLSLADSATPGSPLGRTHLRGWMQLLRHLSLGDTWFWSFFLLLRAGLAGIHTPWCKVCMHSLV